MGTPRKDIMLLLLLVLPLLAGVAVAAPDTPAGTPSLFGTAEKADTPLEKAFSQSGYQYFTFSYGNIASLKDGTWIDWDRDYWAEWTFSGEAWAYDEDTVHIGSDSGVTYSSINGVWDYHYMPQADYGGTIIGFARDEVYTVGRATTNASYLYRFQDVEGDEDWTIVGELGATGLSKMWGLSPEDLYFGGLGGSFVHWNGTEAEVLSSGVYGNILAMWGTAANDIYLIAANDGLLHWDGQNLVPVDLPGSLVSGNLRKIWGSAPDDVWVVGVAGAIGHFDGTGWTDMTPLRITDTLMGLAGSGPDDVWAIGGYTALHYDGTEWTNYSSVLPVGSESGWWGLFGMYQNDGDQYWDPRFSSPANGGHGFNGHVRSILPDGGDILLAGEFTGVLPDTANYLLRYAGGTYEPFYSDEGPNLPVRELIRYDGQIVACGDFSTIDGDSVFNVAAWDGSNWVQLGDGITPHYVENSQVWCVTEWNGNLVLAGTPDVTAMWDGTTWTPLGDFTGLLMDVTVYNGDLYATGNTSVPGAGVLRWDGSAWELLGNNAFSGSMTALQAYEGDLYVAGGFTIDGLSYTNLVRWTGVAWSDIGAVGGSWTNTLGLYQGDLYIGGSYSSIDGVSLQSAALWNPTDGFKRMGSGVDGGSWCTAEIDGALWIGGFFSHAGNKESYRLAIWDEQPTTLAGPPVTFNQPAAPGEDYNLQVSLAGDIGDNPIVIHYRGRDSDSFMTSRMFPVAAKDGVFEGIVPGVYIGDLGFQYYITGGGEDDEVVFPDGDPADPGYAPAWTGVTMTNFEFTPPAANSYVMMGIPFVPNNSQSAILQNAMGTYDKSKWRFGRWNPTTSKYVEFPNTPDFAPGTGYWLIQANRTTLTVNGVSTNTFGGVNIQLKPGWNMISTPYAFPIQWSDVTLAAGVENRLVARSGGTYVDVTVMNPWEGYWVLKNGFDDAVINIPPIEAPVKALENPIEDADEGLPPQVAWAINIAASKGDRSDVRNIAAVAGGAEDGVDVMDFHEPPAMPGDVSLSFLVQAEDRMHHLSTDTRATFTDGQAWDAELRVEGGGPVALSFEGVDEVPAGFEVALITATGRIDLRATDTATVTVGQSGSATLRLAVGDVQYVAEQEQNLPRPFALRPNYPNPFNPRTKIVFTLPYASRVSVDIYDIRGHKVRTLVDGDYTAGLHEVDWLGNDDGGRSVSTGVYFSRMRADGFEQVRKMTLVR